MVTQLRESRTSQGIRARLSQTNIEGPLRAVRQRKMFDISNVPQTAHVLSFL